MREKIDLSNGQVVEEEEVERRAGLVPTGSTLLNLALSDNPHGGYLLGTMVNVVGDSSAGKTFLCWNMFAEVCRRSEFDGYELIYDDAEGKLQIPIERMFGKKTAERVEWKGISEELPASDTVEDFDVAVRELLDGGKKFIYVLDSFDALSDREELKKKELKRDYPAKPRLASQMFRKICGRINGTQSLLVVVSQTREKIGVMFGEKKSRSGGRALRFYSMHELWLAVKSHIKRKDREVGVRVLAKTKKNHLTGKLREVEFDIFHDYGVDDIGSMIDWMVGEGFWIKLKSGTTIDTGGDFGKGTKNKLIKLIEEDERELDKLIKLVGQCWEEVELSIRTDRRPRYE